MAADKQALRQQILAQIDRCAELAYAAGQHFIQHGKHAPSSVMAKADADAKLVRLIEEYAAAGVPEVHDRLAQAKKLHGLGPFVDAVLAECPDAECPRCAEIVCPHGEPHHFHHDGCPACAEHDAGVDSPDGARHG